MPLMADRNDLLDRFDAEVGEALDKLRTVTPAACGLLVLGIAKGPDGVRPLNSVSSHPQDDAEEDEIARCAAIALVQVARGFLLRDPEAGKRNVPFREPPPRRLTIIPHGNDVIGKEHTVAVASQVGDSLFPTLRQLGIMPLGAVAVLRDRRGHRCVPVSQQLAELAGKKDPMFGDMALAFVGAANVIFDALEKGKGATG